jgi:hypothetical protein
MVVRAVVVALVVFCSVTARAEVKYRAVVAANAMSRVEVFAALDELERLMPVRLARLQVRFIRPRYPRDYRRTFARWERRLKLRAKDEINLIVLPLLNEISYAGLSYVGSYGHFSSICLTFCDGLEWCPVIMAHEIGHALGLNHDDGCSIMSAWPCGEKFNGADVKTLGVLR